MLSRPSAWMLALMPLSAGAVGLGEIRLHSHLGEPLQAEVGIIAGDARSLGSACFSLASHVDSDLPVVSAGRVKLIRVGADYKLLITGIRPIADPAFVIGVRAGCGIELQRDFVLLPHTPSVAAASVPASDSAAAREPLAAAGAYEPGALPVAQSADPAMEPSRPVPPPPRRVPKPSAARSAPAGDRLVLGMPPGDVLAPKAAASPRGSATDVAKRIQELEDTVSLLNHEIGKLDQAISLTTDILTAQQKTVSAQAVQAAVVPAAPPAVAEPSPAPSVSANNWLELLLSALLGGGVASLVPRFLARRRERQQAKEWTPLWNAPPAFTRPGPPMAPGGAVFSRQQYVPTRGLDDFDDLSFVEETKKSTGGHK